MSGPFRNFQTTHIAEAKAPASVSMFPYRGLDKRSRPQIGTVVDICAINTIKEQVR